MTALLWTMLVINLIAAAIKIYDLAISPFPIPKTDTRSAYVVSTILNFALGRWILVELFKG